MPFTTIIRKTVSNVQYETAIILITLSLQYHAESYSENTKSLSQVNILGQPLIEGRPQGSSLNCFATVHRKIHTHA